MRCSGSETAKARNPPMNAQRAPIAKKISDAEIRAWHRRKSWSKLYLKGSPLGFIRGFYYPKKVQGYLLYY